MTMVLILDVALSANTMTKYVKATIIKVAIYTNHLPLSYTFSNWSKKCQTNVKKKTHCHAGFQKTTGKWLIVTVTVYKFSMVLVFKFFFSLLMGQCHKILDIFLLKDSTWAPYEQPRMVSRTFGFLRRYSITKFKICVLSSQQFFSLI